MPFDGINLDPVIETLVGAKAIILQYGRLRGALGEAGGPRCVVGAIWQAAPAYATSIQDMEMLRWYAGEAYGRAVGAALVPQWQDARERTLEEVLTGFDKAVEWRRHAVTALATTA